MTPKKNHKLSLDKFINYALYDKKKGYYMKRNPFGNNGDFTTAPNISRLFSEMIAIWTMSYWQNLGSPKKFNLIELGAGNGEMMKVIIESLKKFPFFFSSCNFYIHEISSELIKIQKNKIKGENIKWIKNFDKLKNSTCLFIANEFFDAIPIKQFVKNNNKWFEKYVLFKKDNKASFVYKKIRIKSIEKKLNFNFSNRQNFFEYSPYGIQYLKKIIKIIQKKNGGLLIIDYGYDNEKTKDTLQGIYNKNYSNVLENIGFSDITYNINFNLFKKIAKKFKKININFTTQKKFLTKIGINHRAEILSKNKTFKEKADIYYRLKRLVGEKEMGNLFKVMLIKKLNNNFQIGF